MTLASLVPTMLARLRDAGLRRAPGPAGDRPGRRARPRRAARLGARDGHPRRARLRDDRDLLAGRGRQPGPRRCAASSCEVAADGEILVRGPMVAPRRAVAPTAGCTPATSAGSTTDGRLHVLGRLKELIVTGGENVAPLEVEQALLAHPAVADAGVAGLPDPDWGEAVTAFVVLREPVAADELRDWCRRAPGAVQGPEGDPRGRAAAAQRGRQAAARPASRSDRVAGGGGAGRSRARCAPAARPMPGTRGSNESRSRTRQPPSP